MTIYFGSSDGRDVEVTVPRPLANALLARVEMAEAAAEKIGEYLSEVERVASFLVAQGIGEGRDVRAFVGSIRDLLSTATRPLGSIGQRADVEPDSTCQECGGSGKVDDLRTCYVCAGSGFAPDLSTLQLMS